jgi:DNA-binding transcriptional MerR regulator
MEERPEHLIPIGQFSLLVRLTVRALRLYDREQLLVPAWVDPQTGYRYYTVAQAEQAAGIRTLRGTDLPLDEVRTALADPLRVPDLLDVHAERLRSRIDEGERALALLRALQKGAAQMQPLDIPIEIRDVDPVRGACLETKTAQEKIPETLGALFPQIGGVIRGAGLRGGNDFAVYPDDDFNPQDMTIVVGIMLEGDVPANDLGISGREYGGGRSVVATLRGPYEADGVSRMSQAWDETWAWVAEHGHERRAPAYERYVIGFADSDDPAEFLTEIVVPIA